MLRLPTYDVVCKAEKCGKFEHKGMFSMKSVEFFCKRALEIGIPEAKIVTPRSIVTAEWVRLKCQYGCPVPDSERAFAALLTHPLQT